MDFALLAIGITAGPLIGLTISLFLIQAVLIAVGFSSEAGIFVWSLLTAGVCGASLIVSVLTPAGRNLHWQWASVCGGLFSVAAALHSSVFWQGVFQHGGQGVEPVRLVFSLIFPLLTSVFQAGAITGIILFLLEAPVRWITSDKISSGAGVALAYRPLISLMLLAIAMRVIEDAVVANWLGFVGK